MKKVIAYFVAVATLLCLAGCQQAPAASSAPELIKPVGAQQNSDTFTVERGEIASISMLPGAVVPYVEELSFGVKGVLGKLNVVRGDKVKKGQVVATLNVDKSLNKIAQLESDLTHSLKMAEFEDRENQLGIEIQKVELENLKQSGASAAEIKVAEVELEIAEAKLRQEKILRDMEIQKQQANLDELKKTIEGYELIAPCDGRVVAISAQEGKTVAADKVVVCIADETRRFVSPSFEADFLRIGNPELLSGLIGKIGPYTYSLSYDPLVQYPGVSSQILLTLDEGTESVICGDYVSIQYIKQSKQDVLKIPQNALYTSGPDRYVFKIVNGEKVRCDVETGIWSDTYVEITSGLEEGDELYVKS